MSTCCMASCNKPATVKTVDPRLSFCSEHSVIGSEAVEKLAASLAVWAAKTTTPEVIGTDPRDLEIATLRAKVASIQYDKWEWAETDELREDCILKQAEKISALKAEVERLRAALVEIRNLAIVSPLAVATDIADKALEPTP